jgi:hypothetical protein
MNKRRDHQDPQMNLLHPRPQAPAWATLPDRCREEVIVILCQMLEEHARAAVEAPIGGTDE